MEKSEIIEAKPQEIVNFGKKSAEILKGICQHANLIVDINQHKYMKFEGWQAVASFYGSTSGIESTEPILHDNDVYGYEATAYVMDKEGNIISQAEAICAKDEAAWAKKPLFQLKSMAQTRAQVKALRNVYSWVVAVAGYQPTPFEEMENNNEQCNDSICNVCSASVTEKVFTYSKQKFGRVLCIKCQKTLNSE